MMELILVGLGPSIFSIFSLRYVIAQRRREEGERGYEEEVVVA